MWVIFSCNLDIFAIQLRDSESHLSLLFSTIPVEEEWWCLVTLLSHVVNTQMPHLASTEPWEAKGHLITAGFRWEFSTPQTSADSTGSRKPSYGWNVVRLPASLSAPSDTTWVGLHGSRGSQYGPYWQPETEVGCSHYCQVGIKGPHSHNSCFLTPLRREGKRSALGGLGKTII